jgi:GNAT superfamily N-acetyltransferase
MQTAQDYRIRPALPDDREALEALIALSARLLSAQDYTSREIEAAIRYVFGVDSELVADGTYFVVERAGTPLACGGWSRRRTLFGGDRYQGRESGLLDPNTEPAKIRAFFVHPDVARQGIGRALLNHCEAQARAHGFTSIEMMATLPGVKLYQAYGYEAKEQVEYDMPDGTPIRFVPMSKPL